MADGSDATTGLIVFLILTLIYFIVRYNIEMGQSDTIYTIIYYLGVLVSQYFINLTAITSRCGNTNYYLAFMVTIVPWVFIFGLLNIMLTQFPGWKAPFSNTFGYLIASAAGAKNLLIDHILTDDFVSRLTPGNDKKKGNPQQNGGKKYQSGGDNQKLAVEAVQHIYSDPSLLINEVTPETYDQFWNKMQPLFKSGADEYKSSLYKLIELKELVSEGLWYLLTGSLITSVSANYIMNGDCGTSAEEMKRRHEEYEQTTQKEAEIKAGQTQKVYEVTQ